MATEGQNIMLLTRATARARTLLPGIRGVGIRGVATSPVRFGGGPPFLHLPPPPPPEFEPDGSPKKYPLHQPIWDHGYDWEHWSLQPAGVFHTIYWGDFAADYSPYNAHIQQYPVWMTAPLIILSLLIISNVFQNAGGIGIKPKRYTPEWEEAQKELERVENTNPVTRYLDRRRAERGYHLILANHLPYHPYFAYMRGCHDWDYLDEKGIELPGVPRP